MREIKNPHRIPSVPIHKSLQPFGTILDRTYLLGLGNASPGDFDASQIGKGGGISHSGEVRVGRRFRPALSRLARLHVPDDHGFDFCPHACA
jgi:hypothetical protein